MTETGDLAAETGSAVERGRAMDRGTRWSALLGLLAEHGRLSVAQVVEALGGQGEAYVQRGAVDRARSNLERVRRICGQNCGAADRLAAAITRGPPAEALAAQQPTPTPPAQPRRN